MKRNLTLIELIIVFTIILILLLLTSTTIAKHIQNAKNIQCSSNLKSIFTLSQLYSYNNNNYSMPAHFGDTKDGGMHHWMNYLFSQSLPTNKAVCPNIAYPFDPAGFDPALGKNTYKEASYIMNIINDNGQNNFLIGFWNESNRNGIKISDIKNPYEVFYILDGAEKLHRNHIGILKYKHTDHGNFKIPATGNTSRVGKIHNGKFISLFIDGSTENIKKSSDINWIARE